MTRSKRHPDWKGINKTVFTDDMILHVEDSKESTKTLWELNLSYRVQDQCTKISCISVYYNQPPEKKIKETIAGHQWLTPVILATQEAEIRRIMVWRIVLETLDLEKTHDQKRTDRVAQGVDPEFKPQYYPQNNNNNNNNNKRLFFFFFWFCFIWDRVSYYVDQAGLKLAVLLSLPLKCWDHTMPGPMKTFSFII
jgi:hypothetical protein